MSSSDVPQIGMFGVGQQVTHASTNRFVGLVHMLWPKVVADPQGMRRNRYDPF